MFERFSHLLGGQKTFDAHSQANALITSCKKSSEHDRCIADSFAVFAHKNPLDDSLSLLSAVQQKDPTTLYCHLIAHKIAISEVQKSPDQWPSVLQKVDLSACSRGFFHGVIEGYISYNPDFSFKKQTIEKLCEEIADSTRTYAKSNDPEQICIHAIGHMILVQEQGKIAHAINICSEVKNALQFECYSGVFMENMNRENLVIHGIARPFPWTKENTKQQEALCVSYTGSPASACWRDISAMYASQAQGNYETTVSLCGRASVLADQHACSLSGVSFLTFLKIREGNTNIQDACDGFSGNKELFSRCTVMVIEYAINSSPSYKPYMEGYCKGLPSDKSRQCVEYLENKIRSISSL